MKRTSVTLLVVAIFSVLSACSTIQPSADRKLSGFTESGQASFYADKHHGRKTASGEIYRHELKTAAHKKLPFGTQLRVTNRDTGKSVVVKVNDRGPFVKGRIIDLSKSAFSAIGKTSAGLIDVKIEVID